MGYPIEIANAMPERPSVPLTHPLTGWWPRLKQRVCAWFQRRRRRADHPERYAQGVDSSWPPIASGSSKALNVRDIEHHLVEGDPPGRDQQ